MPAKWVARRDVLQALGAGVAWGPLAQLVGCGDNAPSGRPTAGDAATDRGPLASGSGGAENVAASSDGNDTNYTSHLYFRGKQVTNSTGVVLFDTCFPGWYSGRTIHVHFIIRAGSKSLTSQYLFDDALNDEIIGTQPIYNARGRRDTTNVTDPFVSASQYRQFLFQTQRMPDGAMLAWKAIVVSG
jgi:hypothetical protein